jgi:hypothetical protein
MVPATLMIDRRFRGVGRIKKATGTKVPAVKRKIERMLEALYQDGRLDLLRLIRDGKLTLLEVHDAYQRRALSALPTGETVAPLVETFRAWIDGLRVPVDASRHHVATMGTTLRKLEALKPNALLSELPALLESLRDSLGKPHPRSFNLARSHVMAFVRSTLKRSHPLWLAVAAVEPRKVPKTVVRHPLNPIEMRNWFPSPATDPLDAIAWTMATTGMHAKELWGRWTVKADRVEISGTKREARNRSVPLVMLPVVPKWKIARTFENAFRKRTSAFTPYDLRRTYANWLESAGVPRTRRRLYMGHGAADVTDLYEQHEVAAFLVEDAAKLRTLLGIPTSIDAHLKVAK